MIIDHYKPGEKVKIRNIDEVITNYLKGAIMTGIQLKILRIYFSLSEKKAYRIDDVCRGCQMVMIEYAKGKTIRLNYKQVEKA